jgi:hypothetical protein
MKPYLENTQHKKGLGGLSGGTPAWHETLVLSNKNRKKENVVHIYNRILFRHK